MANYVLDKGYLATGGTAYTYGECVVLSAAGAVARATSAGAKVLGCVQEDLDTTRLGTGKAYVGVRILGISRAIAGAAFAVNVALTNDTSARVVTQGGAAGSPVLGYSLSVATNVGDYVDVLLTPYNTL